MEKKKVRCAIYTRKSCEEGLEQDFNSRDAQREAYEAFIKSQKHEGWILVTKQYNDGGFSGGSLWVAIGLDCNRLSDAGISHCANCISVLSDYLDYHTIDPYSLLLYH